MKRLLLVLVLVALSIGYVSAQIVKMTELPSEKEFRKAVKTIMYRTNGHDMTPKRLDAMEKIQSVLNRFERDQWGAYRKESDPKKIAEMERTGVPYYLRQSFEKVCKEIRTTKVKEGTVAVWLLYNMGYIVKTPTTTFGIDLYSKYTDRLLDEIDFGMITHAHSDHVRGAKELARNGIDIYISSGAADAAGLLGHRIHRVTALQKFTVESFEILPFDVQHDTPEPLGFFIHSTFTGERLLYFTDTYYLKYTFPGLTHIMGECNHSREGIHDSIEAGRITTDLASRLVKSHMSIDRLEEMLKANDLSKLKQIYLLHLSDNNSRPEEFRQRIADLTGVEVLLT